MEQTQGRNFYEWQDDFHNGRFRWRRHPTLFDLFMRDTEAPEFHSRMVLDGKDYGDIYYPAIWQIQRWDDATNDWGPIRGRVELPGMD